MRCLLTLVLAIMPCAAMACLSPPLPTHPTGPTWSNRHLDLYNPLSTTNEIPSADVTVWRHMCPDQKPLVLVTYDPHLMPEVCSEAHRVSKGLQREETILVSDPSDSTSAFCDYLYGKQTFVLLPVDDEPPWDPAEGFTLSIGTPSTTTLTVGEHDPSDYENSNDLTSITGELSGSWYDPQRNGEGFVLEVSDDIERPTAVIYWFTYREGIPFWLIGMQQIDYGQKTVSFELLEVSGTSFGGDFSSGDIESHPFGSLELHFDSCTSGYAAWATNNGEVGEFELSRITPGIANFKCED